MNIQKMLDDLRGRRIISGIQSDQGTSTKHVNDANDMQWYLRNHEPISEGEVSLAVARELAKHFGIQVAWFRVTYGPHAHTKEPFFAGECMSDLDEEAVLKICRGISRARNLFQEARSAALSIVAKMGVGEVLKAPEGFEVLPGLTSLGDGKYRITDPPK